MSDFPYPCKCNKVKVVLEYKVQIFQNNFVALNRIAKNNVWNGFHHCFSCCYACCYVTCVFLLWEERKKIFWNLYLYFFVDTVWFIVNQCGSFYIVWHLFFPLNISFCVLQNKKKKSIQVWRVNNPQILWSDCWSLHSLHFTKTRSSETRCEKKVL